MGILKHAFNAIRQRARRHDDGAAGVRIFNRRFGLTRTSIRMAEVLGDTLGGRRVARLSFGGYAPRDGIPITAALEGDGLTRIAEGVRLMHLIGGARLVVSGGATDPQMASAIGYAKFAVDFGVDEGSIVKLDQPLDTAEEARSVAALVGKSRFILVTSAYHMPRAVRLMELAGARPIPAPTGQLTPLRPDFGIRAWIPGARSLLKTERAIHEYLGMAIVN
jgi:uncharacterized SAM-binding protein YcdF (DUF218 family)